MYRAALHTHGLFAVKTSFCFVKYMMCQFGSPPVKLFFAHSLPALLIYYTIITPAAQVYFPSFCLKNRIFIIKNPKKEDRHFFTVLLTVYSTFELKSAFSFSGVPSFIPFLSTTDAFSGV